MWRFVKVIDDVNVQEPIRLMVRIHEWPPISSASQGNLQANLSLICHKQGVLMVPPCLNIH